MLAVDDYFRMHVHHQPVAVLKNLLLLFQLRTNRKVPRYLSFRARITCKALMRNFAALTNGNLV